MRSLEKKLNDQHQECKKINFCVRGEMGLNKL